jgi:hypothetical protein
VLGALSTCLRTDIWYHGVCYALSNNFPLDAQPARRNTYLPNPRVQKIPSQVQIFFC